MGDVGCWLYGAGDPCNPRCSQSKAKALCKTSTFPKPSRPFKRHEEAFQGRKGGWECWEGWCCSLVEFQPFTLVDLCKQPIGSRHRRHRKQRKQILSRMSLSSQSQSVAGRQDHFNWDVCTGETGSILLEETTSSTTFTTVSLRKFTHDHWVISNWPILKCSHLFSWGQGEAAPGFRSAGRRRTAGRGRCCGTSGRGSGASPTKVRKWWWGWTPSNTCRSFVPTSPPDKCSNSRIERGSLMTPGITYDIVGEHSRARVLKFVHCLAVSPNRSPPRKEKADDPMSRALHGCNCGKKNAEMRDLQGCFASLMIWECFHVS